MNERNQRYLRNICEAFLAAPEGSEEQRMLDLALTAACERLGQDSEPVIVPILRRSLPPTPQA